MKYTIATKDGISKYVEPQEIPGLVGYTLDTREVDPSEFEELGIPIYVEAKIPLDVFGASEDLKKKVEQAKLFFSDLKTTVKDGKYVLGNINIKHIPYVIASKEEYDQLIAVGVEFSQAIDDLFSSSEEENEDETLSPNETEDNVETA